jgi:hypothetical protein
LFSSVSATRRLRSDERERSSGDLIDWLLPAEERFDDFEFDVDAIVTGGLGRLILPIRRRGTRVWIFCSRFLTFARISDTIWTPRFLEEVVTTLLVVGVVEEPEAFEVERLAMVLGSMREDVCKEGNVVDLLREVGV